MIALYLAKDYLSLRTLRALAKRAREKRGVGSQQLGFRTQHPAVSGQDSGFRSQVSGTNPSFRIPQSAIGERVTSN
jgi:hypothetical protein